MSGCYAHFDHTADCGVRVTADTLADLVRTSGHGLYAVIGRLEAGRRAEDARLRFTGDDLAMALRDYLAELLVLFDRDGRIAVDVDVQAWGEHGFVVTVRTAFVDANRSEYHREVKAVTYHDLEVQRVDDGYQATFIVDI